MKQRFLPLIALVLVPAIASAQSEPQNLPPPPPGQPPPAAPATTAQPASTANLPPPAPGQIVYAPAQPGYPQQQSPAGYAQPAYQPVYGAQGYGAGAYAPRMLHRRVVPYQGGPIPPGAVLETHRPMGLVVGGGIIFGLAYLSSVIMATGPGGGLGCPTSACGADWLFAPIVGPWVTLGFPGHSGANGDVLVLVFEGIAQALGVVGFTYGMIASHQQLVFLEFANNHQSQHNHIETARLALVPAAPGTNVGASLSLTSF